MMPKATRSRALRFLVALLLALPLVSCVTIGRGSVVRRPAAPVTGDGAITVASFAFPESVLLAEIYAQFLEANRFEVKRALDLGPRELVEPALEKGLVEFVPEYLGTALQFVTRGTVEPSDDVEAAHRQLAQALSDRGIVALAPARAQNANALAVRAQTAATYGLRSISDLVPIAGSLVLGGPPECPSRPLCLIGLQGTYGLHFRQFLALDSGGPLTTAELASGQIDVAVLFSTDASIRQHGFVLLEDDRALQPAENVTPLVRAELVGAYGARFVDAVDAVSARLTTEGLRLLNALVGLEGGSPAAVASTWLGSEGLTGS
jgi:osmoprotectant transport system substrate-binding protein